MTDTPLSDDVVERVAKAIAPVIDQTDDAETVARAALEAARTASSTREGL